MGSDEQANHSSITTRKTQSGFLKLAIHFFLMLLNTICMFWFQKTLYEDLSVKLI